MNNKQLIKRFLAGVILCAANSTQFSRCSAQGTTFFTVPYDATFYLSALVSGAGATTEFGLGTSQANAVPIFTGLPYQPTPPGEVEVGYVAAGTALNFYERSVWGGTYWAFSGDTVSDASRCAFMDLNNSLGWGGSVVERTGPTTWTLHLDDAASFMVDDNDADVLIQIRLAHIPEPTSAMLLGVGGLLLLAARRRGVYAVTPGMITEIYWRRWLPWKCLLPSRATLRRPPRGWLGSWATLFLLLPSGVKAAGIVTNCAEASLRAAMAGGGQVTFACDGTITLTNTVVIAADTLLDGAGHQITISGGSSVRVFYVSSNVNFSLSNLTIANGRSDKGAGVFNAGGQITMRSCTLANNSAIGPAAATYSGSPGTNGYGGGMYNLGVVSAMNCTFISNSVVGGAGAPYSTTGPGGSGGDGCGGAIGNFGTFIVTGALLANNWATGGLGGVGGVSGQGGTGGNGDGGAIANFGTLTMTSCLLTTNSCVGGVGGTGGGGYYGSPGGPGGPGGLGGSGNGGAFFNNGLAFLINDTVGLNFAAGAEGGAGGSGGPPLTEGSPSGNGGNGGNGGSGYGAVSDLNGQCYLTNCTLALNQASPGFGGPGGPPGPWPYPYPPHLGSPGATGANGPAGSALRTSGAHLVNTLVASNNPVNCTGTITDAGHNLSSDRSPGFTGTGSLTNTDPKLGALANNGGRTPTMALLSGSPAIDAGDSSAAPLTDQRGFPRPAGSAADIGAFEYGSMLPVLSIARPGPCLFNILVQGNSNQWCRLLASSNLSDWVPIFTNQIGASGTVLFQDGCSSGRSGRFYRVACP